MLRPLAQCLLLARRGGIVEYTARVWPASARTSRVRIGVWHRHEILGAGHG
jgi:hypothetical protein